MRFALMIEAQQGLSYEDQLAIVRRAEAAGFESFFRSDHYASFPGSADQATTDAWAVLAGLARETSLRHGSSLRRLTANRSARQSWLWQRRATAGRGGGGCGPVQNPARDTGYKSPGGFPTERATR